MELMTVLVTITRDKEVKGYFERETHLVNTVNNKTCPSDLHATDC